MDPQPHRSEHAAMSRTRIRRPRFPRASPDPPSHVHGVHFGAAAPRTRRHALPNDVSSDSHGYICNDERHDHGEAFRLRRSTQLSRHGFVSRALFGSRVRATEVISAKAYPGFDLVDNPHAIES